MKRYQSFIVPMTLVVLCFFAGCDSGEPKVYKVTGTATRGGVPVPHVILHFTPEKGRPSWGQADEQGKFELEYDLQRKGAIGGKHRVHIEFRARNPEEEHQIRTSEKKMPKDRAEIENKYNEANSKLEVTITENNQVIEVKLD